MAIIIAANFSYNGRNPNFERDQIKTKAELKAKTDALYDEGHLVYCVEDKNVYIFKPASAGGVEDPDTGYFTLFSGSGSSGDSIQVASLPEANADSKDKIYQYVGADTDDYKQGLFYICKEIPGEGDPAGPSTYKWEKVDCCDGMNEIVTDDNGKGLMSSDMKKMLDELWEKANPTTFTVSGSKRERNAGTHEVNVGWVLKRGDQEVPTTDYTVTINNTAVESAEATAKSKRYTGLTANTTYSVKATYNGKDYTGTATLTLFEDYQLFYGVIASDKNPATLTEAEIKAMTPINRQTAFGRTLDYNLQDQKAVYVFPSALGSVKTVKDANQFDYFGTAETAFGDGPRATIQITPDAEQSTVTGAQEYKIYAMADSTTNPVKFTFA